MSFQCQGLNKYEERFGQGCLPYKICSTIYILILFIILVFAVKCFNANELTLLQPHMRWNKCLSEIIFCSHIDLMVIRQFLQAFYSVYVLCDSGCPEAEYRCYISHNKAVSYNTSKLRLYSQLQRNLFCRNGSQSNRKTPNSGIKMMSKEHWEVSLNF